MPPGRTLTASRDDLMKKGEETLAWLKEHGKRGIVLAGRPIMWTLRFTTVYRS